MQNGLCASRCRDGVGAGLPAGFPAAVLIAFSIAFLGSPRSAAASGEPDSRPGPVPIDASLVPDVSDLPWVWVGPELPLELKQAVPYGPEDKGGTYTAMGAGENSGLTERERALLDLSRAAVEASRLNGTLEVAPSEPNGPPMTPAEGAQEKLDALRVPQPTGQVTPGTGAPSDHAVLGKDGTPVAGPIPLTATELEKLAAAGSASGLFVLPPSDVSVQEAEGAPRPGTPSPNAGVDAIQVDAVPTGAVQDKSPSSESERRSPEKGGK